MHAIPRRHRATTIVTLVLAMLTVAVPGAHAGVYRVGVDCNTVRNAWTPSASAGMAAYNACQASGAAGIVARVALTSNPNAKVDYGSYARWTFQAPPGTAIVGGDTVGEWKAKRGGWQAAVWGTMGGPFVWCASDCRTNSNQAFGTPPGAAIWVSAACYNADGCYRADGNGDLATAVTLSNLGVALSDDAGPQPPTLSGPLASGQWLNGTASVNYQVSDTGGGSGIRSVELYPYDGAGGPADRIDLGCDSSHPQPCPGGVEGTLTLKGSDLAPGTHVGIVRAWDFSGNATDTTFTYRVDTKFPGKPADVVVANGEGWRQKNGDFTLSWTNPPSDDGAPIVAAHYELCPAGKSTDCTEGTARGENIERIEDMSVPRTGAWSARVSLEDAAANSDPKRSSDPVTLRFDDQPPTPAGFEPQDPADPQRLALRVKDDASGLADGAIEIARHGSGEWKQLSTDVRTDELVARVDDSRLPKGVYDVRGIVRDRATNRAIADQRISGDPAELASPIRIATRLRGGLVRIKHVRRHDRVRRVVELVRARRIRRHRYATIRGRLLTRDGQVLAGQRVFVFARERRIGARTLPVGYATTDRNGRFRYRTHARYSRDLTVSYPGTSVLGSGQRRLRIRVPARTSIRVHPRHLVLNGENVMFSGRLQRGRIPRGGVLVALQAFYRGHWSLLGENVARTDRRGRWRIPYQFKATAGLVNWRFRVTILPQSDYPFARPSLPR